MDRLSFLGQPDDEGEVDGLLSQLGDEHLMNLTINTHSKYKKLASTALVSENYSDKDGYGVSELSSRLANLKAGPRKQSLAASRRKGKESTETRVESRENSDHRKPSPKREDDIGSVRLSDSTSSNSNRSSGRDVGDDSEEIDANLMARFLALKALPSSNSSGIFPSSEEAPNDCFNSSPYEMSSPSTNLLDGSSARSSPRVMTTSVTTSCHCSSPSPFKLLKQLSSKKLPSKAAVISSSSPSDSSSVASAQSSRHGKPAWKESRSERVSQHKCREAEKEDFSTVKDVQRLLSSVADRVALEGSRVSSAEEDECLSGDDRTFSMRDRELEYLKASSEEEELNREAERVVEWAKDAARLGRNSQGAENEDLEDGEDYSDSGSSSHGDTKESERAKKTNKPKKKWGLF
ncbi:hypothetical protein R1flu_011911 [Riccia fluitans]|uniref:Uncharacterized protein n=1 Tax=Riccia fluitans TaxID=41844 RepID=A0ABD1Z945_9MARC